MLPEFPKAREAIQKVWNKMLFAAAGFSDPLISQVTVRVQREGDRAFFGDKETEYRRQSVSQTVHNEAGRGIPTHDYFGLAIRLGEEIAADQASRVLDSIPDASPNFGSIHSSEGPLTFDLWLAKMEAFELNFDETGKPLWPQWYASEELIADIKKLVDDNDLPAEQRRRREEFLTRKRKEYDEREDRRRLVD